MNHFFTKEIRVLAIDPCTRGFGFAVLEGSQMLIDWGIKEASDNKNVRCLEMIAGLIESYQPDGIVVEDCEGKGSRRCLRVQELISEIQKLASKTGIQTHGFSRSSVRGAFSQFDAFTKHQIAIAIAAQFPELAPRVPPFRKCWMPEHYGMAIFDAVAFGLTFFHFDNPEQQAA